MSDRDLFVRETWRLLPAHGTLKLYHRESLEKGRQVTSVGRRLRPEELFNMMMSADTFVALAAGHGLVDRTRPGWTLRPYSPEEAAELLWEIGRVAYGVERAWDDVTWFGRS